MPNGSLITKIPRLEFDTLAAIMANSPDVLTRNQIMDYASMDLEIDQRIIDIYVSSLRKRIDPQKPPQNLVTIWGVGYAFRP